jgi:ribosomal-protein-alanine N-acetyltransferase
MMFKTDKRIMKSNEIHFEQRDDIIFHIKTIEDIHYVLSAFDNVFVPPLSERIIDFESYAEKLAKHAIVYVIKNRDILGFIAFYANNRETNIAYITQLAIKPTEQSRGFGKLLLDKCIEVSKNFGMLTLKLEVYLNNNVAIHFYERNGFKISGKATQDSMYMIKEL